MTSLAQFPQLRRTLTDVMEDELYHVPAITNTSSNPSQQQQIPQQGQVPFSLMTNYHYNNSNNSLSNSISSQNAKLSPTLSHSRLFRNPSALNSEEMLTIPDTQQQQYQPSHLQELSRIPSHDMYYDIPEPLPFDEDRHVFNEFADPTLTTTNHNYRIEQHYQSSNNELQQPPTQAPAKLLKFNDDLSLDYFTNEDDSKFVIYPVMSPSLIPEEIEDEEISDDDDDEDYENELTYLDNTIDDSKNPLNYQHQQFQAQQEQIIKNEEQLEIQQESSQPQQHDDDEAQALESDIDRMSLDSSDDEYSSNSSVIEEDSYTPTFKTPQSKYTPPKDSNKPKQKRSNVQPQSNPTTITSNNNNNLNNHQCHLINPSTNQPCFKQFSRPYDLIRHQETIHASRKKIFRCVVCNNKSETGLSNKTFSRGDALSRHIRVKHGLTGTEATDALQYAKDHVEYV